MVRITDAGSVSTVDVLFMSFSVVYRALVGFKSSFFLALSQLSWEMQLCKAGN